MNPQIEFLTPWESIDEHSAAFERELRLELTRNHVLWDVEVRAIARRCDNDDVLFQVRTDRRVAAVHLTWSSKPEVENFPWTQLYDSLDAWVREGMLPEHREYLGITNE